MRLESAKGPIERLVVIDRVEEPDASGMAKRAGAGDVRHGSRSRERMEMLPARGCGFSGWASMARVALSAAAMMGIAMGGSMVPRSIAYAQAGPAFEVSPTIAGGRDGGAGRGAGSSVAGISRTPVRIAFHATRAGDIMAFAYRLPLDRIEGRPRWMYDDLYDGAVTTAAPAGLPEQKLLLQKLLEERFGLVVHRISNESPVYFLVPGAKVNLTETKERDAADIPEFRTTARELELSGLPGPICVGRHVSMSDLAAWLYSQVQLPVLDKTGITGLFDVEIPALPFRGGAEGTIRVCCVKRGKVCTCPPLTGAGRTREEWRSN